MRLRSRASIGAVKRVGIFTSGKLSEPRVDDVDIATKSHIEASARWSDKIESQYVQMLRTRKTGKNSISILWLILRSSTLFMESLSYPTLSSRIAQVPGICILPKLQNPNFQTETEKTEAETLHTKTTKSKTIQLIYRVEENPRLLDQTKPQKKHNKYEIQCVFDLRASGRLAWFEEAGDNKMHFLHSWYWKYLTTGAKYDRMYKAWIWSNRSYYAKH